VSAINFQGGKAAVSCAEPPPQPAVQQSAWLAERSAAQPLVLRAAQQKKELENVESLRRLGKRVTQELSSSPLASVPTS